MEWRLTEDRPIWQQLAEQLTVRILKGALAQLETAGLAVGGRTAGRTVTEDAAVIQAARGERAREAVALCLQILEELGYTKADALVFMKEELRDE